MTNWDERFANATYIKDGAKYPERWAKAAQAFREKMGAKAQLNIPYGAHPREVYDHFQAENPRGALVFVHGGYWMKFDKSDWSHLAQGALENGLDVYIPSYPLAPEAPIRDITNSIARFLESLDEGLPLYLVGHSAGGHLVARMIEIGRLSETRAAQIENVIAISGVFDLRNLIHTEMNAVLKINDQEAKSESPIFQDSLPISCTAWVGTDERPEFIEQSQNLVTSWQKKGQLANLIIAPNRHHFDVIEALQDPDSTLFESLLSQNKNLQSLGGAFAALLRDQQNAPQNNTPVEILCLREKMSARSFPKSLTLDPKEGVVGDRWKTKNWVLKPDGSSDERNQISILPARIYHAICASIPDAIHPGDPIIADLDCSFENLPIGQKLQIGSAIIEISDVPNYGCEKWRDRYGLEAWKFIARKDLRALRLRGVLCRIIKGGQIGIDDVITKP